VDGNPTHHYRWTGSHLHGTSADRNPVIGAGLLLAPAGLSGFSDLADLSWEASSFEPFPVSSRFRFRAVSGFGCSGQAIGIMVFMAAIIRSHAAAH